MPERILKKILKTKRNDERITPANKYIAIETQCSAWDYYSIR